MTKTRRILRFLLLTAVTAAFLDFAVVNRQFVHISLFPLPYMADMPLFVFAVLCVAFGIVLGSVGLNLKLSRSKRRLRSEHKHVMALQNEIAAVRHENPASLPAALPKA